jgi:hypothetical protein
MPSYWHPAASGDPGERREEAVGIRQAGRSSLLHRLVAKH